MRYKIPCVIAAAGLTVSCVHQVRTASGYPAAPAPSEKSRPSAMERQIANAVDAGDGDYRVRLLRQRMAADPENLAVRIELIEYYTRAGYPELALEHCRLAAARFPESAEIQLSLAKCLRKINMTREASHGSALALNPKLDYLHNNLGYNLLMQRRPSEAAFEFRQALQLKPDSETARNNLGMALAETPRDAVLHWQSISDPATAHSNM